MKSRFTPLVFSLTREKHVFLDPQIRLKNIGFVDPFLVFLNLPLAPGTCGEPQDSTFKSREKRPPLTPGGFRGAGAEYVGNVVVFTPLGGPDPAIIFAGNAKSPFRSPRHPWAPAITQLTRRNPLKPPPNQNPGKQAPLAGVCFPVFWLGGGFRGLLRVSWVIAGAQGWRGLLKGDFAFPANIFAG